MFPQRWCFVGASLRRNSDSNLGNAIEMAVGDFGETSRIENGEKSD